MSADYSGNAESVDELRRQVKGQLADQERRRRQDPTSAMPNGADLIWRERKRQVSAEGWSREHDAQHMHGEMVDAARAYLIAPRFADRPPTYWPWDRQYWKPCPDDRMRELVKAGALIAAEIDRLLRLSGSDEDGSSDGTACSNPDLSESVHRKEQERGE